jgi:hypothetical protein
MNSPVTAGATPTALRRSTPQTIVIGALICNALLFGVTLIAGGPDEINVPHVVFSLLFAALALLPHRWAPVFGLLLSIGQLSEAYVFRAHLIGDVRDALSFTFAALFVAIPVVLLVASIAALMQNRRA